MSKRLLCWPPVLILLAISGCAPAPTPSRPTAAPTSTPTLVVQPGIPEPTRSPIPTHAPSPTITSTETPLPTPNIPTPAPHEPANLFWAGEPTYPADSDAGLVWRLAYETDKWALITDDLSGLPTLVLRDMPTCSIIPWQGGGLPPDMTVENGFRQFRLIFYEVAAVYQAGAPQFVTYTGGDSRVLTAFRVDFAEEEMETCLADAEAVLATLTSLTATPTPIP